MDSTCHVAIDQLEKLQFQIQRDRFQLSQHGSGDHPGLITSYYENVVTYYNQGCFMFPSKNYGGSHRKGVGTVKVFDQWLLTRINSF